MVDENKSLSSLLKTSECFYYVVWGEWYLRRACASATLLRSITSKQIIIFFEDDLCSIPEDVVKHLAGIRVDIVRGSSSDIKESWAFDYHRFYEGCHVPRYPACYLDSDFVMFDDTFFELAEEDKLIFFHCNMYFDHEFDAKDAKRAGSITGVPYNVYADETSSKRVNNGLFLVFDKRSCQEACILMRANRLFKDECFGEWVTSCMCSFFDHVSLKSPSKAVCLDRMGLEAWYEEDAIVSKKSYFSHHPAGYNKESELVFSAGRIVCPDLPRNEDADYIDTVKVSINLKPNFSDTSFSLL